MWLKLLLTVAVVCVVAMITLITVRSYVNDGHCATALGPGSTWVGGDKGCSPPPKQVDGLWTGMLPVRG